MTTLEQLTEEKTRLSARIDKLDADRARLAAQMEELEAAGRVLARLRGSAANGASRRDRGRPRKTNRAQDLGQSFAGSAEDILEKGQAETIRKVIRQAKPHKPTLGDRVLEQATGKTQAELTAALPEDKPVHIGAVLARFRKSGRIEDRGGRIYAASAH